MPFLDAPPIPAKNVSGTDTTSAQGQEITRKIRERFNQTSHSPPAISGGTKASNAATATTAGV